MNAINKLNAATYNYKTNIHINDLVKNDEYSILDIRKVNKKYGDKVVVDLAGKEEPGIKSIFLPQRYVNNLTEKDIKELKHKKNFRMVFKGFLDKKYAEIEFLE